MTKRKDFTIQPLYYENHLLEKDLTRIELVVAVDRAITENNIQKMSELIIELESVRGGNLLINKLRKYL